MTNPSILFMDWHYVPHPADRLQAVTAVFTSELVL